MNPGFLPKTRKTRRCLYPFEQSHFSQRRLTTYISLTPRAHQIVSLAVSAFTFFTTISSCSATAPSTQQTLKTSFSTFSTQMPSYSNRSSATSSTIADGNLILSPPSHQVHPAPPFTPRYFKLRLHFFDNNSCLRTLTKNWPSSFVMPARPSIKPLLVWTSPPVLCQSKAEFSFG